MQGTSDPVKVFDRTGNLEGTQIISYRVDATGKWCVLVGIAPGAPERPQLVKGALQLYSLEQGRSQALEAHAAAFAQLNLAGRAAPASVIAFAQKTVGAGGAVTSKLHVIELGLPSAHVAVDGLRVIWWRVATAPGRGGAGLGCVEGLGWGAWRLGWDGCPAAGGGHAG
jgi:hypothetical protein